MARKTSYDRGHHHAKNERKHHGLEFWSGTITFGLVSIPIQMLPASRNRRVALREVDTDGTPLRRRFFCPEEERVVPSDQIVRGFEFETGRYVTVTDKELEDLEPRKSREIDLRLFVDRRAISPLFFERSYYLAPHGDSTKAYRLLARVLEKTKRAGIATFVMHDREYLVAIVGDAGFLRGQTLRFLDEVRQPADVGLPRKIKVDSRLSAKFAGAIQAGSKQQLDTRALQDKYAQRLEAFVKRKRKRGIGVVEIQDEAEEPDLDAPDEADETDLLETIRRSLGARSKGRHAETRNGRQIKASNPPQQPAKTRRKTTKTKAVGKASRTSTRRKGRD